MSKGKKILIIFTIIANFLELALGILSIVQFFLTPVEIRQSLIYVIFDFIDIASIIAIIVILFLYLFKKGHSGIVVVALLLSLFVNFLSIASILLFCVLFFYGREMPFEKELRSNTSSTEKKADFVYEKTKEEKIADLRLQREKGEISEEEFNKKLMELL